MSCVEDTNSIDLSVTTGMLTADLVVDPNADNLLSVSSAGVLASLNGGWLPAGATLAYSSTDGHTFVATTSIDLTAVISVGSKFRLVQSATTLYFVVTAISSTTVTLYGGTLYTLTNAAITAPFFSYMKAPVGFNTSPENWTETFDSSSLLSVSTPTLGTVYNPGGSLLSVPIGAWKLFQHTSLLVSSTLTGDSVVSATCGLSTSNSGYSDSQLGGYSQIQGSTSASHLLLDTTMYVEKNVTVATKTAYYLVLSTLSSNIASVALQGNNGFDILAAAVCAYL